MTGKRLRSLVIVAVAALGALFVLLYPTDEKRVRAAAEALVKAASGTDSELRAALNTYARPEVSLNVTELPEPIVGRQAVVEAVHAARALGGVPHVHLESVEVRIEGKTAKLRADVITSDRPEVPELRRPRHSVLMFRKTGDVFQLVSAEIGAERLDQPEARP
jgi:hypothetical protein